MDEIVVPLSRIFPRGEESITARPDGVAMVTDPRQWAYSAEADFDIRGFENESWIVKIFVEVESGVLGVGLPIQAQRTSPAVVSTVTRRSHA